MQASVGTVKTTIRRLEIKGYIIRKEFKNGRGGWSKYELSESVYKELLQIETNQKSVINWEQSGNKLVTNREQTGNKVVSQPVTSLSSSSSNLKTTTTALPPDWIHVDIQSLAEIGLTTNHLAQLYKQDGCSPELVQDSIYHFAFDLKQNNKAKEIKTSPLGYFMGIMKKVGVYAAPDNYESPSERALRLLVERKKAEKEKLDLLEKEMLGLHFADWYKTLTAEKKKELLPEKIFGSEEVNLRAYYADNIWPSIRHQFLA